MRKWNAKKKWIDVSISQNEHSCSISVEDNGKGISSEQQTAIFDKGFTTKGQKGSGIGLYLVNNIVDKGLGEIEVFSRKGEGMSILITFPMILEEDSYEQATGY